MTNTEDQVVALSIGTGTFDTNVRSRNSQEQKQSKMLHIVMKIIMLNLFMLLQSTYITHQEHFSYLDV